MANRRVEEFLLLTALLEDEETERNKKSRKWIHEVNRVRRDEGEFCTLYPLQRSHKERFFLYFRMDVECFDELLNLIKEDIQKEYTNYREPIEPAQRLAVALRFLATGDSYSTIGHSFRMGFSTVSDIVVEVCTAIWQRLQPIYMPEPTSEIWENVICDFQKKWQFPNCIGSIDGKHVTIKCPSKSDSNHYCYLHKFSTVLLAIVDADYKFLCIDVGAYRKNSNGGIFEVSNMGQRFASGIFDLPVSRSLLGQNEATPCVLVGDEAFTLSPYLMRPYPYRQTRYDDRKGNFNKRLCRARRVVKNAFGVLSHKWRVFHRPMQVKFETTISIVKATCILHKYLRIKNSNQNFQNLVEPNEPGVNNFEQLQVDGRRATNFAFEVRESYNKYFKLLTICA